MGIRGQQLQVMGWLPQLPDVYPHLRESWTHGQAHRTQPQPGPAWISLPCSSGLSALPQRPSRRTLDMVLCGSPGGMWRAAPGVCKWMDAFPTLPLLACFLLGKLRDK